LEITKGTVWKHHSLVGKVSTGVRINNFEVTEMKQIVNGWRMLTARFLLLEWQVTENEKEEWNETRGSRLELVP
jgi:hypothetical protein